MSGARLFLAEKPSVARELAQALGARKSRSAPRYEGHHAQLGPVWVSWCIGHLVEIAEPGEQDPSWQKWRADTLPMLPGQLRLRAAARTRAHFDALRQMIHDPRVARLVNACDAGREGELIFRYVYVHSGSQKPTERFWTSSLTGPAIAQGLRQLRPGTDYDPLGAAARCRAEADWLVGMNATRALSLKCGDLRSVGRVQTPTLALIVERELAIEAFVPEDYWLLSADGHLSSPPYSPETPTLPLRWLRSLAAEGTPQTDAGSPQSRTGSPPVGEEPAQIDAGSPKKGERLSDEPPEGGRLPSLVAAQALKQRLENAWGQVTRALHQQKAVAPPQLYDLTSLQREANRRFGASAQHTLDAAQKLYETHKILSYPRTDSRHLSSAVAQDLPNILATLAQTAAPWAADAARCLSHPARNVAQNRRYVDDAQVTDHHALLPTTTRPDLARLTGLERRIYELVVRRTLAIFAPDALWAHSLIEVVAEGECLEARGRSCLSPGWQAVDPPRSGEGSGQTKKGEPQAAPLPPAQEGDRVQLRELKVSAHKTRPPPRYSEASLLGAMERAGSQLDEAELRSAMREGGLGTPATRAATLETLITRAYVAREGRSLYPLPAGRALIETLPVEALKSPRLTGEWEARLQRMARGAEPVMPFRQDIRRFVRSVVAQILSMPRPAPLPQVPGRRGENWRSLAAQAKGGAKRRGERSARGAGAQRSGSTQATPARGVEGPAQRRTRASRAPSEDPVGLSCPACGQGTIIAGRAAWGCDQWRAGCTLRVPFEVEGVEVPAGEAARLFGPKKQTRLFTRREGKRWRLVREGLTLHWQPGK